MFKLLVMNARFSLSRVQVSAETVRSKRRLNVVARLVGAVLLLTFSSNAFADHGAPPPRLEGVTLCLEPASVRLKLEEVTLPGTLANGVIADVAEAAQNTLASQGVPTRETCEGGERFVLLELYIRFLDPATYVGFPANSYTYVVTTQVGSKPADMAGTVLPEGRYAASVSDIVQAATAENLAGQLVSLGNEQAKVLAATWRAANVVPPRTVLMFAALGVSLLALRGLTAAFGRPR